MIRSWRRGLSANRLSLDLGVPSGRITDILNLNGRRSISADRWYGLAAIPETARNSGSTCKVSTTLL
jgi:hypothetical protein